jgi:hypothetical protein
MNARAGNFVRTIVEIGDPRHTIIFIVLLEPGA